MSWLFFIDAKNKIFNNSQEIIENTCLLVSVIDFTLAHSSDYISKSEDFSKEGYLLKLLNLFNIRDTKMYKPVKDIFNEYIKGVIINN